MNVPQSCRDVLIEKNLSALSTNSSSQLFLLKSITEESYSKVKHSASANYYGDLFSGDYNDFEKRRDKLTSLSTTEFSEEEALSALTLTGLPGAVAAWKECMIANKAGFFSWIEGDPNGTEFTLYLQWEPARGIFLPLTDVVGRIIKPHTGTARFDVKPPMKLNIGVERIGITRSSKNVAVRGYFNGKVDNPTLPDTSESIAFFIPPDITIPDYYISDYPETLVRDGNIHEGLQFNTVYWQKEIWIANILYEKALGMHPMKDKIAFAEFKIPEGARYFRSIFGLARHNKEPDAYGRAKGRILIDGNPVWDDIADKVPTQTDAIGIPKGAKILRLEVNSLGDSWADRATWANPRFSML